MTHSLLGILSSPLSVCRKNYGFGALTHIIYHTPTAEPIVLPTDRQRPPCLAVCGCVVHFTPDISQWLPLYLYVTRLPSNRRPTTRECVHLVTHGHFRSCDKAGGHTIRSAVKPILHANFITLYFIEPELLPIEVLSYTLIEYGFSTVFVPVTLTLTR